MKKLLLVFLLLAAFPMARAGVNIEPYLGYAIHNSEYKGTVTTSVN
ncbi:MAG: hypothetical protein AABY86_01165 [Bdellovibrionota bacterium]